MKKKSKIVDLNPTITMIILDVNDLESFNYKAERVSLAIKAIDNFIKLYRITLYEYKDLNGLKVKGRRHRANNN